MSRQKNLKELKRKYGKLAESMQEHYHHLDLRPLTDLTDDGLEYILEKVRTVDMLDLNETAITNKSISLLRKLERIKELRLKECYGIDDRGMEDMNQLTFLELLHLGNTGVTIDGVLQLGSLNSLHTLLFSAENISSIMLKLEQLQSMHPDCEIYVNGKRL